MSRTLAELTADVETVSQRYARVCAIERDDDWYLLKLQEELGELVAEALRASGRGRMDGASADQVAERLADEAADLFGGILLFAHHRGIDLEAALERKWFRYLGRAADGETR